LPAFATTDPVTWASSHLAKLKGKNIARCVFITCIDVAVITYIFVIGSEVLKLKIYVSKGHAKGQNYGLTAS